MTETKDALVAVRAAAKVLALGITLPERPASRILVEKLRATHAARATPQAAFLEGLRDRLVAVFRDGQGRAPRRGLQGAPWLLWPGNAGRRPHPRAAGRRLHASRGREPHRTQPDRGVAARLRARRTDDRRGGPGDPAPAPGPRRPPPRPVAQRAAPARPVRRRARA